MICDGDNELIVKKNYWTKKDNRFIYRCPNYKSWNQCLGTNITAVCNGVASELSELDCIGSAGVCKKRAFEAITTAGLDEGLLSFSRHILVCIDNPYRYNECQ
jgi:hypothetical protein